MNRETGEEKDDRARLEEEKAAPKCAMNGKKAAAHTCANEDCQTLTKVEKAKAILALHNRQHGKKTKKERKRENVSPSGLHQLRDRLENTKEQSKHKQFKVGKLTRRKLTGR